MAQQQGRGHRKGPELYYISGDDALIQSQSKNVGKNVADFCQKYVTLIAQSWRRPLTNCDT